MKEKDETKNQFTSTIHWISVKDRLPDKDRNVLTLSNDYIGIMNACITDRPVYKKIDGIFQRTDEVKPEWGFDENGGEYWHDMDVVFWAEDPVIDFM